MVLLAETVEHRLGPGGTLLHRNGCSRAAHVGAHPAGMDHHGDRTCIGPSARILTEGVVELRFGIPVVAETPRPTPSRPHLRRHDGDDASRLESPRIEKGGHGADRGDRVDLHQLRTRGTQDPRVVDDPIDRRLQASDEMTQFLFVTDVEAVGRDPRVTGGRRPVSRGRDHVPPVLTVHRDQTQSDSPAGPDDERRRHLINAIGPDPHI